MVTGSTMPYISKYNIFYVYQPNSVISNERHYSDQMLWTCIHIQYMYRYTCIYSKSFVRFPFTFSPAHECTLQENEVT